MTQSPGWQVERYRHVLQLQARQLQLDPRLRRRLDSSDLVQDALLKAHERLAQFRGTTEGELVRWLQEILAHEATDRLRREKAKKRDLALERSLEAAVADSSSRLESFLAAEQSSPSEQAAKHELLLRLAEAIDELPEAERDVVIRRDLNGEAVAQIAEQLGRTEKSVAGLLQRGRQRLRDRMAKFQ